MEEMINFTINGRDVSVPKGTTVYNAAKQLGIDIPIFCYHDRMPPFGACRMCLVEVEKFPKLQASCTLEAAPGMAVKTHTENSIKGREEILEFLLINHPLDCPICDKGGECPLQDQTLKFGPGASRFYEEKRLFYKPLPLGPVLMLDRERCIVCARCTRFGDVIAGDHALEFVERGFRTEVGTPGGGPAESKFIGNTIMICPVGALTSQVYRFRARPWDNDTVESTCTLCPVGCSMLFDSRDGEVVRTRSKENKEVNDVWLCDKGWFGYEFADSPDRLKTPLIKENGRLQPITWDDALAFIAYKMIEYKPHGKLAAFGGTTLTVEGLYLLQKLMREAVGVNNVDYRIGLPIFNLEDEGLPPGMELPIKEVEDLSYAVLLGFDITEEFPVIWLRLKQAINHHANIISIGHFAPEVRHHLKKNILHAPGKELEAIRENLPKFFEQGKGKKGAIFVGRQYLASSHRKAILAELAKLRLSFPDLTINLMEGSGNSMGARWAGMHPELAPMGEKVANPGKNAIEVIEAAAESGWDFLYVAGADPATKFPSNLWSQARAELKFLVVQDLFLTETAKQADIVLPALSYVEKKGSFINIEGRIQNLQPGKAVPSIFFSDADIFIMIANKLQLLLAVEQNFVDSLKSGRLPRKEHSKLEGFDKHEVQNGGLFATFSQELFDNGVRMQHNPHLEKLAKPSAVRLHPIEGAKRGINNGDHVKLEGENGEISAEVKLDDSVAESTVVIPTGFKGLSAYEFGPNLLNGISLGIKL